MRGAWFVAVGITGCGFTAPNGPIDGDVITPIPDAELDARPPDAFSFDANPALCFGGAGNYKLCLPSAPAGALTLGGTIDTTSCAGGVVISPSVSSPNICVLSGTSVTASGTTRVIGLLPLAVISTGTFAVPPGAVIDASSATGGLRGAAANYPCTTGSAAANAGGGQGGSFQSSGGAGGDGGGGSGGQPGPKITASFVRGGCRGLPGAPSAAGGFGGDSGGAIYLAAEGQLTIAGKINASGAGGGGARASKTGGGGAGSGGMIVLFGNPVSVAATAQIWANGGGGGGGGGPNFTGGSGGESSAPRTVALGGAGDGNGGNGSDLAADGQAGTAGSKGGHGGGGGAGVIENLNGGAITIGTFSPPAL